MFELWQDHEPRGALGTTPYVDLAALGALATLLQDVVTVPDTPSQVPDWSAASSSPSRKRERCPCRASLRLDLFSNPAAPSERRRRRNGRRYLTIYTGR